MKDYISFMKWLNMKGIDVITFIDESPYYYATKYGGLTPSI
jgi:hypothetical protein